MAFSGGTGRPQRPSQTQEIARQLLDRAIPVIPIRPLSLGDIMIGSARAVARHWKVSIGFTLGALVAAVAIFAFTGYVLIQVTMSVLSDSDDPFSALMVGMVGALVVVVALLFAIGIPGDAAINGVVTIAADRAIRGASVEFAEVFALMRQRFWPLCRLMGAFYLILVLPAWFAPTLALMVGGPVALLVAMPVLFIGEFVVGILFSLAPIVLVLEGQGVGASLKRSVALAKPAFWRLLGLHLVWVVMVVVVLVVSYLPIGLFLAVIGQATFGFPVFLLAYLAVAVPLFRTAQTLIYTDLRIREGAYGQDLIRDIAANAQSPTNRLPAGGGTVSTGDPIFALKPFHVARVAAAVALVLAIVDLPGIPWLIIAAGCAVGEWQTRTKSVPWPLRIHEVLAALRLATPTAASSNSAARVVDSAPPDPSVGQTPPPLDTTVVSLTKPPSEHAAPVPRTNPTSSSTPTPRLTPRPAVPVDLTKPAQTTPVAQTPQPAPPTVTLVKHPPLSEPTVTAPGVVPETVNAEQPPPEYAHPARTPRLDRRNLLAVFTLGVLALLVTAGGITWWLTHPSATTNTVTVQSDRQLRNTFPEQPSVTWTVDASRVFKRAQFKAPIPSATGALTPGFIDLGDTVITTAYLPQSDRESDLVAIDAATGEIRWTAVLGFGGSCASRTIDGLLPCFGQQGMGPDRVEGVWFFRMSDGSLDHRIPASKISRVEVVGDDVITAGFDRISRGKPDNLTSEWSVDWKSVDRCLGSGDAQYFGATEEFVYFGSDAGSMVLRATDGKRVIAGDATEIATYPGHGLVAVTCPGGSRTRRSTVVLDRDGTTLRTHDGEGGYAAPLVVAAAPDSYLADGSAYNFADGKKVWSGGAGVTDIVDDTVVLVGDGAVSGIDFNTGASRWTQPFNVIKSYTVPFQWLTDRQHVILTKDGALQAINLRTGATAWTIPRVGGNAQRAGNGLAVIDADRLTFYGPTGGPATGEAVPAAGSDRTQLVTRCGKAPQLTPVQYRTDTDGLVVRMQLRAACSGGDIISTDALRVSITQADQSVASGAFDFSRSPLYLPPTGADTALVQHEFKFPFGTFWRLPNSLGSGADPGAQRVDNVRNQLVACVDVGTSKGPSQAQFHPAAVASSAASVSVSVSDQQRFALDALRAQADADRPSVQGNLADRWLPQLSSKQLGLVAPDTDGRIVTWSASEILNQHLRLRVQYPEVRLVWSDEWRTFDLHGWWVTIAGTTFGDPNAANSWCDARNIAIDECFAKLISNTRDSKGTTQYRAR
ncbi:PQQ-binding-like beta-propeller repeat protein [Nocardia salmonicida]|uniref:outer membrane protein assembly factor BamB family protein n=1 Tax=Nocardia salmonicida TaxID=53431 RepID=UPI003CF16255